MTTPTHRYRPHPVSAVQWTGSNGHKINELWSWAAEVRYRPDQDEPTLWVREHTHGERIAVPFGWWVVRHDLPDDTTIEIVPPSRFDHCFEELDTP